jgi:hypothetical protein
LQYHFRVILVFKEGLNASIFADIPTIINVLADLLYFYLIQTLYQESIL